MYISTQPGGPGTHSAGPHNEIRITLITNIRAEKHHVTHEPVSGINTGHVTLRRDQCGGGTERTGKSRARDSPQRDPAPRKRHGSPGRCLGKAATSQKNDNCCNGRVTARAPRERAVRAHSGGVAGGNLAHTQPGRSAAPPPPPPPPPPHPPPTHTPVPSEPTSHGRNCAPIKTELHYDAPHLGASRPTRHTGNSTVSAGTTAG